MKQDRKMMPVKVTWTSFLIPLFQLFKMVDGQTSEVEEQLGAVN
jgi:hypothetical protein